MITQKDIDNAGTTRMEVARRMGIPYGTLSSKINGYAKSEPNEERAALMALEQIVLDREKAGKDADQKAA